MPLALCTAALLSQRASAQLCSQHTFIGDSPSHGQPGWHSGTQGLAHDSGHWYITNTHNDKSRSLLWRIPVGIDLATNVACGHNGVSCSDLVDLRLQSYDHYGDPDFFEYDGRGFVLVPLESSDAAAAPPGILVFRADASLQFLTLLLLTGHQRGAPWVAVAEDGIIYTSEFNTQGEVNRFYLDWADFVARIDSLSLPLNGTHRPALRRLDPLVLHDQSGAPLTLKKIQGGEFSDDGRRFYLSNGDGKADAEPDEGVHVFTVRFAETAEECGPFLSFCQIAREIERSHNSSAPGFAYEFHPGANAGATGQEPEGLTFWDLDALENAPGTGGQLHVVLLDNDFNDQEEVYVKHYAFMDIDSDPPTIVCPPAVTAECVSPAGRPRSDARFNGFFAGASATDSCTGTPRIGHDAPVTFPLGTTAVTFTATDASGNVASCQAPVTIVDTTPPVISVTLSRDTLWPPNHTLVPITAQVTVADACGPAEFQLVSISSNEPDDGSGDGHTARDIQGAEFGTSDTSFLLRAERSGSGQGREYTVVYRVSDGSGNASVASAVVRVPRWR